jgi:hypothetical protein
MGKAMSERDRPDVDAAERGGDWTKRMAGEGVPEDSNLQQAVYWSQVYTDIYAMEEKSSHASAS